MYSRQNYNSKVRLYGYGGRGGREDNVVNDMYDHVIELDNQSYRINAILNFIKQQLIKSHNDIDGIDDALLFVDEMRCAPYDVLQAGGCLDIVKKKFRRYRITFLSYGRHSIAMSKDPVHAEEILDTLMHQFQIGYIDALDWRERKISRIHTVHKPPTNFLRRKQPCVSLRDYNIDLDFQKKIHALWCQYMDSKLNENYALQRIEREKQEELTALRELYSDQDDENFEDFLQNNPYTQKKHEMLI